MVLCRTCGSKDVTVEGNTVTCKQCGYAGTASPPRGNIPGVPTSRAPKLPVTPPSQKPVSVSMTSDSGTAVTLVEGVYRMVDTYQKAGEQRKVVQFFRPSPAKYIPDLALNVKQAEVQKWKHGEQFKKDRRFGRDWLKKHGYVKQGQVEQNGKMVDQWVKDQ